jgi:hypothetical protein
LIKLILSKDDATFKAGVKKIVDDLKNMGAERVLANDTAGNIVAISARDALKK